MIVDQHSMASFAIPAVLMQCAVRTGGKFFCTAAGIGGAASGRFAVVVPLPLGLLEEAVR